MKPARVGKRYLTRLALGAIAVVCILAIGYVADQSARENAIYMGLPSGGRFYRVLRNDGFMVGYSDLLGSPLWVSYRLTPIKTKRDLPRPNFRADFRAFEWITPDDYTNSGFDRGHLAPNYAISQLYGKNAQLETFLMTNIAPQKPNLNRKVWQRLEAEAIDNFAVRFEKCGGIWVITGGIYDGTTGRIGGKVAVPSAFFAVFVAPCETPQMLAFIVPQGVEGNERLSQFVVSVDEVEKLSGFDLFSRLPDPLENELESAIAPAAWQISKTVRNRF
ncbi:DNA/RNA non-specific endonuclease [Campylobacterota bacterium]|nr:DNA/RNA non-specific endonuclease [Campylobacterota bacterium]